jgi:hypothetical protein
VLFLDEPTVGLDPQTRSSIWEYIGELRGREEITIFMTTHYMDEAEYCDRIAIMDNGQIIALDTPAALKASVGKDRVQLRTAVRLPARGVGHDLRGVKVVMHRELIRFWQDRMRIVVALVQPVLFLFVLGTGLSTLTRTWRSATWPGRFWFPVCTGAAGRCRCRSRWPWSPLWALSSWRPPSPSSAIRTSKPIPLSITSSNLCKMYNILLETPH